MKTNLFINAILSFIFLSSCAFLQGKKDPSQELIAGNSDQFAVSVTEVEEALTQYESMGAGTYKIRATVLTPALLELREKSKPFSEEIIQKNILESKKNLSDSKTCFQIALKVINQSKYAYFDEWKGRVFVDDSEQKLEFPLEWTEESLKAKPKSQVGSAFHGKTDHYYNEGVACTETRVPLQKGFTLKLLPSYIQWPFDGTLDLSWSFVDPNDKTPKKVKERYRGW